MKATWHCGLFLVLYSRSIYFMFPNVFHRDFQFLTNFCFTYLKRTQVVISWKRKMKTWKLRCLHVFVDLIFFCHHVEKFHGRTRNSKAFEFIEFKLCSQLLKLISKIIDSAGASFIPISRISTNLRHQLYNNTRADTTRIRAKRTIECHHFSGFPVRILTPPRRPRQTQKLATIWWASLTTYILL